MYLEEQEKLPGCLPIPRPYLGTKGRTYLPLQPDLTVGLGHLIFLQHLEKKGAGDTGFSDQRGRQQASLQQEASVSSLARGSHSRGSRPYSHKHLTPPSLLNPLESSLGCQLFALG